METRENYFLSKLNNTTSLIVHRDKYVEFPFIYVKLYSNPPLAVVFDTGCGAHNGKEGNPNEELKDFIEVNLLTTAENNSSLRYQYLIICTHCHFDHIGGIEAFARLPSTTILVSGFDRTFLSDIPTNSLCPAFGIPTPNYDIDIYANDGERIQHRGVDLGLQVLHTPGHTPDSLAIYDETERWLFTGDTLYKRVGEMPWGEKHDVPIVFPLQGDWKQFNDSLKKLANFVDTIERDSRSQSGNRIRLAAGHTTADSVAAKILQRVQEFVRRVEQGKVPIVAEIPGDEVAPGGSLGDDGFLLWREDGEPEFSLIAPKRFKIGIES